METKRILEQKSQELYEDHKKGLHKTERVRSCDECNLKRMLEDDELFEEEERRGLYEGYSKDTLDKVRRNSGRSIENSKEKIERLRKASEDAEKREVEEKDQKEKTENIM